MRVMAHDSSQIIWRVAIDTDDITMNNATMRALIAEVPGMSYTVDYSQNKIQAINRAMVGMHDNWNILVLASDDMIPQVVGWDKIIRDQMAKSFPDGNGILWYNDGYQPRVCTMSIYGKKFYIERLKRNIYHPDYTSLWCDNEITEIGKRENKLFYSDVCLFKHEHYSNNNRIVKDELMKRNDTRELYLRDEKVFNNREKLGFPY